MEIKINKDGYRTEKQLTLKNRETFKDLGLLVINMIGSPDAGKTMLLKATLEHFKQNNIL